MAIETQSNDEPKSDESRAKEKLLEEAKARFKLTDEAEKDIRSEALDDMQFAAGDQWPEEIKSARAQDRRPCLTINRLPQHIRQVTNDQRQNRPSIKAHPVDDTADVETAKVYSGLIRHIEYNSNADAAYDTAFEGAVRGGRGFFRIITDYVSPTSFEQEILIKRIRNPLSVFFDPYSKEPDGSDANFAFVIEDISKDEYLKLYPESKLAQAGEWESVGNSAPDWMGEKSARVAEYFYKDTKEETIVLLDTGEVVLERELEQMLAIKAQQGVQAQAVQKRTAKIPTVKWAKLNACEILEETDWPGSFIPIVPVLGEELDIDGKRVLKGIVRDAKDPQRMLNFWKSAETEAIALAPKAPFIAAKGQIEGFEHDWATANTRAHAVLEYNPTAINGTVMPPPQRQAFEPAVQAITQAAMLAADDLKATTGIHDATLGARSNESSGIAIQRRNNQAQTSNFHFVDNLTRSLRHAGRILIDLIPKIYDTARTARIIGEDGEQKVIKINEAFEENGEPRIYQLSAGKYDVTVDVGPSYATKRQEAAASMVEVVKAVPQVMQSAPDLIIKNMDWPGAAEISERLKKTLPPQLVEDPNQKSQQIPPQVQAQMQQMGAMLEQLQKDRADLLAEREQRLIEIESKERIEMKKLEVQVELKRAELDSKNSLALLNAEIDQINGRLQLLNVAQPIEHEEPNESQDSPMPQDAGAPMGADGVGMEAPAGGEMSPEQPMEGMNNVDPSNF